MFHKSPVIDIDPKRQVIRLTGEVHRLKLPDDQAQELDSVMIFASMLGQRLFGCRIEDHRAKVYYEYASDATWQEIDNSPNQQAPTLEPDQGD